MYNLHVIESRRLACSLQSKLNLCHRYNYRATGNTNYVSSRSRNYLLSHLRISEIRTLSLCHRPKNIQNAGLLSKRLDTNVSHGIRHSRYWLDDGREMVDIVGFVPHRTINSMPQRDQNASEDERDGAFGIHVAHPAKLLSEVSSLEGTDKAPVQDFSKQSAETDENSTFSSDYDDFRSGFFPSDVSFDKPYNTTDRVLPELSAARSKTDLSYQGARKRENTVLREGRTFSPLLEPSTFRKNAGIRQVVGQYMQHIQPLIDNVSISPRQNQELEYWLRTTFSNKGITSLKQRGYEVEDVVTWSWIFSVENSQLGIRRYISLAENLRTAHRPPMPLFIPLQLLRAEHIDFKSFTLLLNEIETGLADGIIWGKESGAILLVRLLRYARLSAVSCYERIAELAPRILPFETTTNTHDDVQRLTHFYNRFLSLIALPCARHPFLSVDIQQRSQLKIARSMMESKLQIYLNREGYRALARVQLMHKKTIQEQQWSSVKSPSWPPWRRDELGIDATIEYPGRDSRVSKVIKRLLEAGYGPESMEQEAQILSGWDTDKSPTTQVRRITIRRPLSWIRNIFKSETPQANEIDHNIWAARVAATRSIREAWVCFYSYMHATMDQKRQLRVYCEMFYKIFARTQQTNQRSTPSPGDGKEVYPDPLSPRDLVYVHKEPPTVDELYAQMLQDGLLPTGRLLAGLIDNAPALKRGLEYIENSSLGDVKKDVLLHSEKYPKYFIKSVFSTLPEYFLASYLGLMTKHSLSDEVRLFWPGSKSTEEHGSVPQTQAKPLHYGIMMLEVWGTKYMPAYHAALEGICMQARSRHTDGEASSSRVHSYSELWRMAKHVLQLMRDQGRYPDLICFRKLVLIVRNCMIRAPTQFRGDDSNFADTLPVVKSTFAHAVQGAMNGDRLVLPSHHPELSEQPFWKDIESLMMICGFGLDYSTVVDLLRWMQEQQQSLDFVTDRGYKMQRLVCAARVALDGSWHGDNLEGASQQQVDEARSYAEKWGWPEDVDIEEFLGYHRSWIEGMRAAAWAR